MRHLHTGRKLGVDSSHRIALLRSLTLALIEQEAIRTLPSRAKELRWYADRIVTLAKKGDLASRRQIIQLLGSSQNTATGENRVRKALDRLYEEIVPRFKTRNGGYTQIMRLALRRAGDNAELCLMRYIPEEGDKKKAGKKAPKEDKKGAEKKAAAPKAEKPAKKAATPEDKPAKKSASKDK